MAILLVTYDLKQPGRNYQPLHDWLKQFTHCKGLESVWLLDTEWTPIQVRDELIKLIDQNDQVFVTRLVAHGWAGWKFGCSDWLKSKDRTW